MAFAAALDAVANVAPDVAASIRTEAEHQRTELKLIASENYADPAVLLAMGNWLTDKYAEGAPGRRSTPAANKSTPSRFELPSSPVICSVPIMPTSSPTPASTPTWSRFWAVLTERVQAPYLANLSKSTVHDLDADEWESLRATLHDQTLLGMDLNSGGHLTHGFRHNISGKLFRHAEYSVDPATGLLDYEQVRKQALEHEPLIILAGYSSYPRRLNFRIFPRDL